MHLLLRWIRFLQLLQDDLLDFSLVPVPLLFTPTLLLQSLVPPLHYHGPIWIA